MRKDQRRLTIQLAALIYKRKLRSAAKRNDFDAAKDLLHHGIDGFLGDLLGARLSARQLRLEIRDMGFKPLA